MSSNTASRQTATASSVPESRPWLSVAIIAHFFFVLVCLGSNFARSELAGTLLDRFAPYTRLFNFDLDFTPYHLTHGSEADVNHRLEVLPQGSDEWIVLPSEGFRGADGFQRYQRLAAIWNFHATNEGQPAVFAQAIGSHFSIQRHTPPRQIRCRRHYLQPREEVSGDTPAQRDPDDPSRFAVVYAANAIVNPNGWVDVIKIEETGQVALPVGSSGATRGNTNERGR